MMLSYLHTYMESLMTAPAHDELLDRLAGVYRDLLSAAASDQGDAQPEVRAFLGMGSEPTGDYEEPVQLRAAHDVFQATARREDQAAALEMLGQVAAEHGDAELAQRRYRESRFIYLTVSPPDAARLQDRLARL
jgi:hypothetical protein